MAAAFKNRTKRGRDNSQYREKSEEDSNYSNDNSSSNTNIDDSLLSSVIILPFKLAGKAFFWVYDTISNTAIVKDSTEAIKAGLKDGAKSSLETFDRLSKDDETKILIGQLTKDFLSFFGSIVKEVGVDATNEFFQIFFQLLMNMGVKLISGIGKLFTGLIMSVIGEIPVVGGIADLIGTIVNSFNDVIGSITPIIRTSARVISAGLTMLNKVSSKFTDNPVLNKISNNLSILEGNLFGDKSFFGFMYDMFEKMKGKVNGLFSKVGNSSNSGNSDNQEVRENILGIAKKSIEDTQTEVAKLENDDQPPAYTRTGGRKLNKTKKNKKSYLLFKSSSNNSNNNNSNKRRRKSNLKKRKYSKRAIRIRKY